MLKKAFVITVRSSSSRLPEKCFRSIYPKLSLTEFIIERCLGYGKFDVILATTKNKADDYLIEVAKSYGIKTFRGSEEDKITRWVGACQKYKVNTLIACDGDDPFVDLKIGEKCSDFLETEKASIVEAINLPCGSFTYAINFESLLRVANNFDTSRSEMINYFFKKDKNSKYIKYDPGLSYEGVDVKNIRITVDFIEDLIMARKLSKFLKEEGLFGSAQEIINIYREKPEIFSINQFRQIEFKKNQQLIVDTYK